MSAITIADAAPRASTMDAAAMDVAAGDVAGASGLSSGKRKNAYPRFAIVRGG